MVSRNITTAFVSFLFLLAMYVVAISFGLYLMIYIIVLIPAIIAQVYAMIKAYRKFPQYNFLILLSTLTFLAFALVRPDADQHGTYSGYSAMAASFGIFDTKHVMPWDYALEICLVLIVAQIFMNTYILRGLGKIPK